MEYLNFHIRLPATDGNSYQKVIIDSPAGREENDIDIPLHDAEFQAMLTSLWNVLLNFLPLPENNIPLAFRATPQQEEAAQEVGKVLFTALFKNKVLQLYDDSLYRTNQLPDAGLLLRFEIEEPELAALPWELLYDARESGRFISCYRDTPIVRTLPQPHQNLPPLTTQPLRLLCMVANPDSHHHLDVEREKQHLHKALRELEDDGSIEIHWIAGQTWRDLQEAMRTNEWHIFHFTGHGSFDELTEHGKGSLTFVSEHGDPEILTAEKVAQLLGGHSSLRLVVLNACEGARNNSRDIFSSTATTLLSQCHNLMAVLAMQHKITDRAAVEFTRTFYGGLAQGLPVETAVTEARVAIGITMIKTLQWATPVLYTRSPHPILFTLKQAQRVEAGKSSAKQGTLLTRYDLHANWVSAVAWSPDGTRIASSGGDATVRIWNPINGENIVTYHGQAGRLSEVLSVAWSPDSTRVASGGNRATIQVWNASNKQLLATYAGHAPRLPQLPYYAHVFWVAWSPDGNSIASTSINLGLDKAVHIWKAATGRFIRKFSLRSGIVDTSSAGGVAWSPDGTCIAAAMNGEVRIYNVTTGSQVLTYKQQHGYISALAWSPDGKRIASMDSDSVQVWNATTRKFYYAYRGHTNSLRDVAWSPDGQYLASSSNDRTVQIWTAESGTRIFTYTSHLDEVGALSWAPDSRRIASASKDKTVHIWQAIS